MTYHVTFTQGAIADVIDIWQYIADHDSITAADYVIEGIRAAISSLRQFPERGQIPLEFDIIQLSDYRQVHFKPYRIIYQLTQNRVQIYCVIDGRRDIQSALQKRLLRP